MPNIQTYNKLQQFRCLTYGRFKSGKTFGAGTFPRPNFLSFDKGMATLANSDFVHKYGTRSIWYEDFYERSLHTSGVVKAHNAYDDACRYFDAWMNPKGQKYKSPYTGEELDVHPDMFDTWVLDSGTTLISAARNKAIMLLGDKSFTGGKALSQTYEAASKFGMIVPKMQDYGAERSLVEQFIAMIYDSGKHFVLLAHEKEITDDGGGVVVERVPLFTGQSVEAISLKFDEVYRLDVKKQGPNVVRSLQTTPDSVTKCGSRLALPNGTEWSWDAIQSAIGGATVARKST